VVSELHRWGAKRFKYVQCVSIQSALSRKESAISSKPRSRETTLDFSDCDITCPRLSLTEIPDHRHIRWAPSGQVWISGLLEITARSAITEQLQSVREDVLLFITDQLNLKQPWDDNCWVIGTWYHISRSTKKRRQIPLSWCTSSIQIDGPVLIGPSYHCR